MPRTGLNVCGTLCWMGAWWLVVDEINSIFLTLSMDQAEQNLNLQFALRVIVYLIPEICCCDSLRLKVEFFTKDQSLVILLYQGNDYSRFLN